MGITHDLALLDCSVLSEQTGDLILSQAGVDAGDEEVGARVDSAVIVTVATTVVAAVAGLLLGGSAAGKMRSGRGQVWVKRGKAGAWEAYRSAPGEAERRRVLSLPPMSLRGEALRLSRS